MKTEFKALKEKTRELDKLRKKIANTPDHLSVEKLLAREAQLKRQIKTMARLINIRLGVMNSRAI